MSYRTRLGGELRKEDAGQRVTLAGWVARRRDHGGLVFVDLRDPAGIVQLVFDPSDQPDAHAAAHELRNEFVVQAEGVVALRDAKDVNPELPTGEIDVRVDKLKILNRAAVLPFQLDDEGVDETLRLHHRYLDLRRDSMRRNIETRFRLTQLIRRHMEDNGFWDLETPILYKSTPEGAREFLVPTSARPGQFYALPQSPQTFKQLYAIAGYERYYQIARCFRDEATRADRTQEFTQLDIEMAFMEPEELFGLLEPMFARIWNELLGVELETPFQRITWDEATLRYASDKPDLRFGLEISDVSDLLADTEFKAFRGVVDSGGVVRGFAAPGALDFSRKDFDDLVGFAQTWGGKGVAWLQVLEGGEIRSPIAKFLSEEELRGIVERIGASEGDTIFLVADQEEAAVRVLGPLRLHLGEKLGLIQDEWRFVWVTDFPMFEWLPDENRWKASHNPFSAPAPGWEDTFDKDPAAARSYQYDLVLNGNEIGGGSIRNHRPEVQSRIFELLGISAERQEQNFSFLLRALAMGAPPHGGIAFGLDRLAMLVAQADSLREVIAFPKAQGGVDPLTGSPTPATPEALRELGLRLPASPPGSDGS
ncbi:MAG: aspartyl-tRNA synthetase [Gaiellales bacterium]|jgi:aspartyl-tRNA synthetase|nr:aspartyl-tRNA synthetase [Gaiellales bacterium]